jgi:hypothetical protein
MLHVSVDGKENEAAKKSEAAKAIGKTFPPFGVEEFHISPFYVNGFVLS